VSSAATVELDGQYRALRESVGLVDRVHARLRFSGPDAADYLEGQLTNEIDSLEPGGGCYAALLDRKGHMQGDMRVLRIADDEIWLDTEPVAAPRVLGHLDRYRIGRELEIDDVTDESAMISAIGPGAAAVAGVEALRPEYAHVELELDGAVCRAIATDLGIDFGCAAGDRAAVRRALIEAGAVAVSEDAAEIARVESGRPRFGAEMDERTIPAEAGIDERAVSFTKGCYIGQETVARLHYKGKPNRHLRGLRLDAPTSAGDAIELADGGRELGRIGTACLSPAHGPIALAIVRREAGPGDRVKVGEDAIGAEIVELPF
jgi:tRNA-modifying protein YgfZ